MDTLSLSAIDMLRPVSPSVSSIAEKCLCPSQTNAPVFEPLAKLSPRAVLVFIVKPPNTAVVHTQLSSHLVWSPRRR